MLAAHKIELDLNNVQKTYMAKACGCARFAYNWALDEWRKMYLAWKADNSQPKPNQYILRRKLNAIKREKFSWMLEVTKCAVQQAIINLGEAFARFFKKLAKYPQKHKKGRHDSFTINNDQIRIDGKRLRIPNLGWVKLREHIRFNGIIKSVTISKTADRWFASFTIETPNTVPCAENQGDTVGVDLGVKTLATLSDGTKIDSPKPLKKMLQKLRYLQKSLHRKLKGSRNRFKARMKLARCYARIANIREDFLHKLTSWLAKTYSLIGIEDLNVAGMLRNHKHARAISDLGFYEFKRQLTYKCEKFGAKLVIANRWFPSSKTCSDCGYKLDDLELNVREWICPVCGAEHDRDINAAINLRNLAVSSTVTACGEASSGSSDYPVSETGFCEAGI